MMTTLARSKQQRQAVSALFEDVVNILSENKTLKFRLVNEGVRGPTAYWNHKAKKVVVNVDRFPAADDDLVEWAWLRAKAYHELGHVLFTWYEQAREKLAKEEAHHPQAFLALTNVLEDGKVERLMRERFRGVGPYLDWNLAMFRATARGELTPLTKLALYVRDPGHPQATFPDKFAPWKDDIDDVIAQESSRPIQELALTIDHELYDADRREPEELDQHRWCHAPGDKDDADARTPDPFGGPEPVEDDEGRSKEGADAGLEPADDGDDLTHESGDVPGTGDSPADLLDDETWDKLRDRAEQDREKAHERVRNLDPETPDSVGYNSPTPAKNQDIQDTERGLANRLAAELRSLHVEARRNKYRPDEHGRLDTHNLARGLAGGRANVRRTRGRDKNLAVAMLLDTSGSMGSRIGVAGKAARATRYALCKAGIPTLAATFDTAVDGYAAFPTHIRTAGGTDFTPPYTLAGTWFDQRPDEDEHRLVILVSDGCSYASRDVIEHLKEHHDATILHFCIQHEGNSQSTGADVTIELDSPEELVGALRRTLTEAVRSD